MSNRSTQDVAMDNVARWQYWIAASVLCATAFSLAIRGPSDAPRITATEVRTVYEGAEFIQRAAVELTAERGLIYAALNSPGVATSEWWLEVESNRERMRFALDEATSHFDHPRVNSFKWPITSTGWDLDALTHLREQVGIELSMPLPERRRYLANVWFRETTRMLEAMRATMSRVHLGLVQAGAAEAVPLRLHLLTANMADFIGRERAFIAAAVGAQRPLSAAELATIEVARERVVSEWKRLENFSRSIEVLAQDVGSIERVQSQLFGEYLAVRDAIVGNRVTDDDKQRFRQEWFTLATAVIESICDFGERVGRVALEHGRSAQRVHDGTSSTSSLTPGRASAEI